MVFKMLSIEWWSKTPPLSPAIENLPGRKCRQLFVTRSRLLADKVEEYFARLFQAMEAATSSPSQLKKIAADVKSKERSRQLREGQEEGEEDLVHADDLDDWRSSLPERFSFLRDEDFPLFITYDRVSSNRALS